MRLKTRTLSVLSGAALCASLVACGGDSSSPAAPTPVAVATPVPCTQTTVLQGAASIPASTLSVTALPPTTSTGRVDVIVDWTFANSVIGVYLIQGGCTLDQFNARTCNFLIRSDSGAKPRKVSAANVAPGSYLLYVGNFSSQAESSSAQVFLSSSTCPALTSRGIESQAHDGAPLGQATRIIQQ